MHGKYNSSGTDVVMGQGASERASKGIKIWYIYDIEPLPSH